MPVADDVVLGAGAVVTHPELVNLYGCIIGTETRVGPFVEIQKNVVVGTRCKISSHSFLCEGLVIEDEVFIGHGVLFINDRTPRAAVEGRLAGPNDWKLKSTVVRRGASIGSGAIIMCGIEIGEDAMIGAGAVVTQSVPAGATVAGVPARLLVNKMQEDQK